MRDLVAFLVRPGHARGLFPCTSMFELRLGRVADFESHVHRPFEQRLQWLTV
jgi:hypothetical protein